MAEWAKVLLGVATGGVLVLFSQWLGFRFQRRHALVQRVLDLYAEFVGVASNELERAQSVKSALVFKPPTNDDQFSAWLTDFSKLEERRHAYRADMARLSVQIRVLEDNETLRALVEAVCHAQPVFNRLAGWQGERFDDQFEKHESEIEAFSEKFDLLCRAVLKQRRP